MNTKLTLSLDKGVIENAKKWGRQRGQSLSKIVEEHFQNLNTKENKPISVIRKLSGILKDKIPADVDWKVEKGKYLKKKYGL
jgi:hypothetical protein